MTASDIPVIDAQPETQDVLNALRNDERLASRQPHRLNTTVAASADEEAASGTYDDHVSGQTDFAAVEARDHDIDAALVVAAVAVFEVSHHETTQAASSPGADDQSHFHTDGY